MTFAFGGRAALVAAMFVALAGCKQPVGPAYKPLSAETKAQLAKKGMDERSPMFVRIFKEESQLELWKVKGDGQYALFKTYPICKWSGQLGPKQSQGDKQSPEGFYTVSASQLNPNSNYYLAFNIGFPNAYDRAHGRTGKHIMVHGNCKSVGCFAMTDAYMEEIYILAREAFKGGQDTFQVQALPFRMTAANLTRHKDSQWAGFWKDLKAGYDAFERAKLPPRVDVCTRKYLVNASFAPGQDGPCPSDGGVIDASPPADQQQMASATPAQRPSLMPARFLPFGFAKPSAEPSTGTLPAAGLQPQAVAQAKPAAKSKPTSTTVAQAPAGQTVAKSKSAPPPVVAETEQPGQAKALGSIMGTTFGQRKPTFNGFLLAPPD